ncbi:MAG: hypothetical protein GX847_03490 [Clostridiales bacterium]|nr:hypothetical protein [Clostridiales bacterium]
MKKFIIAVSIIVLLVLALNTAYYRFGLYIDVRPDAPVTTFMTADENTIYLKKNGMTEPFEIRGVNMGVGMPGKWATDYAIDKETYLRWFDWIEAMGANTIRVYTILHNDFYDAFYEYNLGRDEPLYLLHGVWINDYIHNSHRDAYDDDFRKTLLRDCRDLVDVLHGKKNVSLGYGLGSGSYRKDVSPWVIGYIIGVEWEDVTVAYTNDKQAHRSAYRGTYMFTTEEASPFEALLCEVGDKMIEYETKRYKEQRLVAFSNWPTTDPFDYPEDITRFFLKCAKVDVEHIRTTDAFISGHFASYQVYPYYRDYLNYEEDKSGFDRSGDGRINTYLTYLRRLTDHHTMPVVISEYGVSTGRGMAQRDFNTGRNQGNMSESDQGEAIIECYEDIMAAGSAGSCVFTWQDEWFKRPWNTMHAVDLDKTPYWSDYQTNEQYFGLLAFDPGSETSISYVDGDISEWQASDLVCTNRDMSLSMMYDEKFVYFLIHKPGYSPDTETLFIPLDTTPRTGSTYAEALDVSFERESDFLIVIDGCDESRILVQERYEVLRAMYLRETADTDAYVNPIDADTPVFKPIELMLQTATPLLTGNWEATAETYETGKLTHGNANPASADFNSLADFIIAGDYVELKLPWQLLNVANPADMMIHDDYYLHYGVEHLAADTMHAGISDRATAAERIPMMPFHLKGWGNKVTFHERLKSSYYLLKDYWTGLD